MEFEQANVGWVISFDDKMSNKDILYLIHAFL